MYTVKNLLNDCTVKKGRTRCVVERKRELLENVWKALNLWIDSRFDVFKGVNIPNFGKITWETITASRNVEKRRPVFILSESFAKTHGIQWKRALKPPRIAHLEDVNYTKLAIKFSKNLTKDDVFSGMRDIFQRLGQVIGSMQTVSIEFNVGKLIAKNGVVHVIFDLNGPAFKTEKNTSSVLLSTPPSVFGDFDKYCEFENSSNAEMENYMDEEAKDNNMNTSEIENVQELEEANVPSNTNLSNQGYSIEEELQYLQREGKNIQSCGRKDVIESAYQRYLASMENEVVAEEQNVINIRLLQQRDLKKIEEEEILRRQKAKDLQRSIKDQIAEKEKKKAYDKLQKYKVDCSSCSIITRSEMSRLDNEDEDSPQDNHQVKYKLNKSKIDLKKSLQEQIRDKEKLQIRFRDKRLQDDREALEKVQNEIKEKQERSMKEQSQRRKVLTDAWQKDNELKQALNNRKKKIYDPKHLDKLLQQSSPTKSIQSDYSIGFDIRSQCNASR